MSRETYSRLEARGFWALAFLGAAVALAGFLAAHAMETSGHVITGMNNQVVWGLPHVFAIFMIVAASGVLNVASIGSVFGHAAYKARAPLSGLLCLALLSGGLFVLMLDLGRPERVVVAATHYNFRSVFAWNVFLYSGMFTIVAVYLWTLMERRMAPWSKPAGLAAFVWRIILTSGTGSIFAFLVARQAYGTALLIPMFLAMSFAWGLAAFLVVQSTMYAWNGLALPTDIQRRMRNLLALFVVTVLFLVAVLHLVNGYFAKNLAFERFILADGGVYPVLFWGAYVVAGSLVPLALIWRPGSTARDLVVLRGHVDQRRPAAPQSHRLVPVEIETLHDRPDRGIHPRHVAPAGENSDSLLRHGLLVLRERVRGRTQAALPEDVQDQVRRTAVSVVELEKLFAVDRSSAGRKGVLQPGHAGIEGLRECRFLGPQRLLDQRALRGQLGIGIAHHLDQRLQHAPELAIGLQRAQLPEITDGPTDDAAKHVAAPFVGRHHAIDDQERAGPDMVADDAQRLVVQVGGAGHVRQLGSSWGSAVAGPATIIPTAPPVTGFGASTRRAPRSWRQACRGRR